jgi:hypothetical protein
MTGVTLRSTRLTLPGSDNIYGDGRVSDAYAMVMSELRYAILGRLLAGPATLPVLLRDLHRAAEEGIIPGGFTIADVVSEVKLYIKLGLIAETDGVIWAVREAIPNTIRGKIERLSLGFTRILGVQGVPTSKVRLESIEA